MSKIIDQSSSVSTRSELDLFTVPPTQVAIKRSFWSEIHAQNPITNDGPYEFKLSPDLYMLDMSKNYMHFFLKIVKADNSNLNSTTDDAGNTVGDVCYPINLIGKTFFRQVKLYLNGKLVSDSGDRYAYRSYIETELNFGGAAKNSYLQAARYYPDPAGEEMAVSKRERFKMCKNSAMFEVMASIHSDLFMQNRFLISQMELRLELYRNPDAFCIIDSAKANNYKMLVDGMTFNIKKVEINDSINLAIESMLLKTTVKYPIRRTHISTLHITDNRRSTPLNSLFTGASPRRIVVGLIKADSARGTYESNPFLFEPFSIQEIKITSGAITIPSTPYKLDFNNNQYLRPFIHMFESLGIAGDNNGNMIGINRFKSGSTFFVFDLGPDAIDDSHWELIREGTTSLEIIFADKVPAGGIECIIYSEFDSMMMIDHTRTAFFDYSV
jgi:hypothetical protein